MESLLYSPLNSNLFVGLMTVVVGSLAIVLYSKQKRDYKRDVASLITQEIIYAEQQVGNARAFSPKGDNYPLAIKLLPTNSWYKNIHLFIDDFERTQIDAISRFYAQIEYMDVVIERISDFKLSIIEEKVRDRSGNILKNDMILPERVDLHAISQLLSFQGSLQRNRPLEGGQPAQNMNPMDNAERQSVPLIPIELSKTDSLFAESILKEVSGKVAFVYNTPIGEKFKEISESKLLGFY